MPDNAMDFRILGPLEVLADGEPLDLVGQKQRALLAALLLDANRAVSRDRLIDALWEDDPPESAQKALQVYVFQLRKAIGKERLETRPSGYLLRVADGELDADRFERLRDAGRLAEALALWRGSPLADLRGRRFAQPEIARLEESRLACVEDRIDADLDSGRHVDLVGELEALVLEHPLRQRFRAQLMLALYRSGRDAEALDVYQDARQVLVEELGIEPHRKLRDLQQAILRQDPALDAAPQPFRPAKSARRAFVGREVELDELRAGLDEAQRGHGRLFLLAGEPGIGKSRLAEELSDDARARGTRVLVGRCWEAGGAPAYWPWVQSLGAYVRESDPATVRAQLGRSAQAVAQLLPELRESYPELEEPLALEPATARFRLFEGVSSFLRRAAEEQPLLLVLDDLHAADEPSLLLLRFVARELAESRLLVVGAYRDVDPGVGGELAGALTELAGEPVTRTLSLGGLAAAEVGRYIELVTASAPAEGVLEAVYDGTDGNPLFVGEIVRLLAAEGRLDAPRPRLSVPQSVRDVIARRVRYLSEDCKQLLELASVLGREFDLDLLARAGGLESRALFGLLDEAIALQLVTDVPGSRMRMRFGHALFRDVLYEDLTFARRRRLHQDVGEALEQLAGDGAGSRLAELAHHFCEAVPAVDRSKAVDYARRAGDQAVNLLAPEEAVRLYETALSLVDDRERPWLLLRTARSMWMQGASAEARAVEARDALVAQGDRDGAAEAELLLADFHWYGGSRRVAAEDLERALGFVAGRPVTATTADVLEHAARFHMLADEQEAAIEVGRRGLAIAEQLGLDGVAAHCLSSIGVARACSGDLEGLEDIRRALELALAANDGWASWRARVNLADCLLWQVGDAERAFAERHELRRLLHAAHAWPITRWNQSYDAWEFYWRGRWDEALRECDDFIRHVEAGNAHNVASEMYALRARIRASRDDERGLDDARAAVALGRRASDARILYPALADAADVAAQLGWASEADAFLDELLSQEGPEPFAGYVVPLALAARARGRADDAAARLCRGAPSPWRAAAAASLRGDDVEAAARFASIGVWPEEARARLLAAEALARAGRSAEAEAERALCAPFFAGVGASAYLRRSDALGAPLTESAEKEVAS